MKHTLEALCFSWWSKYVWSIILADVTVVLMVTLFFSPLRALAPMFLLYEIGIGAMVLDMWTATDGRNGIIRRWLGYGASND